MSALWNAIVKRIKSALVFICPFCATDYQYAEREESEPKQEKDVYEPRKAREKKHIRKTETGSNDSVIRIDEEVGFSNNTLSSTSQCADLEVDNSDELNRILIRKSQFLPPEPFQPSREELDQLYNKPDDTLKRTLRLGTRQAGTLDRSPTRPTTLLRQNSGSPVQHYPPTLQRQLSGSPVPQWTQRPQSPAKSPDYDTASQYSKRSRRSSILGVFGRKNKKPKKDADNTSLFSFASFKSGKSYKSGKSQSSISEKLDKKERKRKLKEEKKEKKEEAKERKEIEQQEMYLSHGLNHQKFENIYPWMNEVEPLDDEFPNFMEEIRIKEAQLLNDDKSYAAESFLDLGSQMAPVSQMAEPIVPAPLQNRFGIPDTEQRKPFTQGSTLQEDEHPRITGRLRQMSSDPETDGVVRKVHGRLRQMSSDPETDGVVRKARKSLGVLESISVEDVMTPHVEVPAENLAPEVFQKKDIFASLVPQQPEPQVIETIATETKQTESSDDDRDIIREIRQISQSDDFIEIISERSERRRPRSKRKSRSGSPRAEKEKRSRRKEKRSDEDDDRSERRRARGPSKITSNAIEDRSIDDIPIIVEKDVAADLSNPLLFPEIPIVNYTRNPDNNPKKDTEKVESIKEIQNTLDRIKSSTDRKEDKIANNELRNETTRIVVDETLVQQRLDRERLDHYFSLDPGASAVNRLSNKNNEVDFERDIVIKDGIKSPTEGSERRRRRRGESERSERSELRRRSRIDETEEERSERHEKHRERRRSLAQERRRNESEAERSERHRRRREESDADRSERRESRRRSRRESEGKDPRRRSRAESDRDVAYKPRARRSSVGNEVRSDRKYASENEANVINWVNPGDKLAEVEDRRSQRRSRRLSDRARSEADLHERRESRARRNSAEPNRRISKANGGEDVRYRIPLENAFSPEKPPIPDRKQSSPVEVFQKNGTLKAFPSHIARDIKNDAIAKRKKSVQEQKQFNVIRRKMDLDFQSVDTKRSVFMINNANDGSSPAPKSGYSDRSNSRRKDKRRKESKVRRVSSRPNLDPVRSQEMVKQYAKAPVIRESDEDDKSGSTLHSGDEQPQKLQRRPSNTSNDSTLKDIDDIPSIWNASVRSRQLSARSFESADSRVSHRSQISARAHGRVDVVKDKKEKKKKIKKKK